MANIKISDLTAASVAADANEFEINEAGTSKKVTGSQIKAFVNADDGALAAKDTVATADIDNLAVTTDKIAADAVDGTKIADDAIDSEHYAADSIDSEHYAPGSVDATAIADNAVGATQLNVPGDGTSGQYLASDGDGTMTWTDLPVAAGGFSSAQVFTSPGTWTNPGNITKVQVTVVGGAGGSATNTSTGTAQTGGTSSFGAYATATGGTGGRANPSGANGNAGTGSIPAGTVYRSGSSPANIYGQLGNGYGHVSGAQCPSTNTTTTWSVTQYIRAGSSANGAPQGGQGGLAAGIVTIPTSPVPVTVGVGGNSNTGTLNKGMGGCVIVEF